MRQDVDLLQLTSLWVEIAAAMRMKLLSIFIAFLAIILVVAGCNRGGSNEAEDLYRTGLSFQMRGSLDNALESYSEALEIDPEFAVAYIARAEIYARMGEYQKSIADLDKAIELDLQLASAYYLRRSVYNRLDQPQSFALDEFNETLENVSEVIKLARAYAHRGVANSLLGDHEAAIQDFDKAIELNPSYVSAYLHRATSNQELGNQEAALKDLNEAILLDPQNADALAARAASYSEMGQTELAIKDFELALRLRREFIENDSRENSEELEPENSDADAELLETEPLPDLPVDSEVDLETVLTELLQLPAPPTILLSNIGTSTPETAANAALRGLGDGQQSLGNSLAGLRLTAGDLDRAIELLSRYAHAYADRGAAYLMLGQVDDAIRDLNTAIELDPLNAKAYADRGLAYLRLGQHETSIQDLSKAMELDPLYAKAHADRGSVYVHLGQNQLAIQDLNKAIDLNPFDAQAYGDRGAAYIELEQHDKAFADLDRAIRLTPMLAGTENIYGAAYFRAERPSAADEDIRSVVGENAAAFPMDSRLATVFGQRGLVYSLLGEFEPALQDFNQAIRLDPGNAEAYENKISMLVSNGKADEAELAFETASEMGIDLSGFWEGLNGVEKAGN